MRKFRPALVGDLLRQLRARTEGPYRGGSVVLLGKGRREGSTVPVGESGFAGVLGPECPLRRWSLSGKGEGIGHLRQILVPLDESTEIDLEPASGAIVIKV
jgi:hypothetical protein